MLQDLTANPEEEVKVLFQPWQLLLLVLAGWVNRQRQDVIEYLLVENRILRQNIGKKRILLTDQKRRSLVEECLERMIFFGERSLQAATVSYVDRFPRERNHQGVGNRLLMPGDEVGRSSGEIACRERLGGLLRYYYREAA
jgi:hypothetical protein